MWRRGGRGKDNDDDDYGNRYGGKEKRQMIREKKKIATSSWKMKNLRDGVSIRFKQPK